MTDSSAMHDSGKTSPRFAFARWAVLPAIVGFALGLRLYRLNYQSVWYDEVFSLYVSHQPIHKMTQYLVRDFVHPPLHYFLLHVWLALAGFAPYQGRLLSVVFGTLAIVATFLLGDYLFDRRTASIAAVLLAVSQLGVMYSQEARPYAQLLFLLPCCSCFFLVALRTGRAGPWWGFVCAATLIAYTNYYGFFAIFSLLLFAALYRKRYRVPVSRWIGGAVLALVLYLPWLSSGFVSEWLHNSKRLTLYPARATWPWWEVLVAINTFNNGRPAGLYESSPWWTFLAGGLLFSVPVLMALKPLLKKAQADRLGHLERENLWFLAILFAVPFSAVLGVGFLSGVYAIRYALFAIVPYYLLVARGISALDRAGMRAALVVACVAYSIFSLRANYQIPYKEDYRDAYAYLAHARQAGDCYVVAPYWEQRQAQWAWAIYHESEPGLTLAPMVADISSLANCQRVWLISVLYRSSPYAAQDSRLARELLEQSYISAETRRYFWIRLDLYVPTNR